MEINSARERAAWWRSASGDLSGLPGGGLNIAYEALDRHVQAGRGDHTAIRWLPKDMTDDDPVDISFATLLDRSNRFANALGHLGLVHPVGVASLCGRVPQLYVAALGTLKAGGVYSPLFSAFGPDPLAMRLDLGRIQVLVTSEMLFKRKILPQRERLEHLSHILLIDGDAAAFDDPTVIALDELLDRSSPTFDLETNDPESPALLHFTSGTTGTPKGALHVHSAVVAHAATGRAVLDLAPDRVYWCTADPGWVTGTSYGIIAPLVIGATSIIDEAEFDAERWYRIIEQQRVEVFYTAPTALRMLKRIGSEMAEEFDLSGLRLVASVGEPLDAETHAWAGEVFAVPVLDTWWQTETGAIMVANRLDQPIKPGSMGRPIPGVEAEILLCDDDGELRRDEFGMPVPATSPDEVGELALGRGWPSMFRTYLGNEDRYRACFAGRWYVSGDLARRDADGYYWFVGRNNDVIKTAGHLVGPFEVESALLEHPDVVEAGVIGKPDDTVGAVIKAFVVLADHAVASPELERDIHAHGRRRLGAAVAPREIEFVDRLPHTRSGKIMRRLLLARELGLDEGDTSALEGSTTADEPARAGAMS
jgi:acetyl-CoA synthetase